jgi:hypothetical protein
MTGFVYFLRCQGYVKIGWSKTPELRLRALRTALPFTLDVLAVHPGTRADEQSLHHRFASQRYRGEWFVTSEEIEAVAKRGFERVALAGSRPFRAVVDRWPSSDALAVSIGAKPEAVRKWRQRDRIPSKWWLRIIKAAEERGFDVTAHEMAEIAANSHEDAQ